MAALVAVDALSEPPRINPELLQQILDAAETCFDRRGVERTTMDDVAQVAGLSRGLIYKYLGNRGGVVLAVLERRARLFNDRARVFIESQPTLADALVEGILLAVRMAHRDPYFGLLVGSATLDASHRIPGASESARALTDELWRPVLQRAHERNDLAEGLLIDDVIDWVMYLELTLLAGRDARGATEADQMRQLRMLFAPAVIREHPL